ncbi:polysaccharide biosynthesis/export family protein [Roseobacter sp. HKCCA0434]|uniref:polysaccharide biosynthesis/export family protein n=1 Tax=Roseobacter sp. HKCCA0434 TaxID=3079297 RepID=UPI002905A0FD|nr:polysaccharide biosynthesis/export family protein [Roseobacter sp. HKCCA0434]
MNAIIRGGICLAALLALGACDNLPRSGPTIAEITAQPADGSAAVGIIPITDDVARLTEISEDLSFSSAFLNAPVANIEVIQPLDVLNITVWENGEFPLFGGGGGFGGPSTLADMRVGLNGTFFMPQVGTIQAAGKTVEQLRRELTARLAPMTPEPQVEVRLESAGTNTVRIFGSEGALGEIPIGPGTRTLSGLIANAPAAGIEPDIAQLSIRRGNLVERVWVTDIFNDPSADIALRGGDVINIERDARSFIALGELGQQAEVEFPGRDISLMEALALLGGLNGNTADPRGVFVLREERPDIYQRVTGQFAPAPVRIGYVMDLTKPAAFFIASNFDVRDGDIIFVSEAPYVQFLKIIGSIAPPINSINSTLSLATNPLGG